MTEKILTLEDLGLSTKDLKQAEMTTKDVLKMKLVESGRPAKLSSQTITPDLNRKPLEGRQ